MQTQGLSFFCRQILILIGIVLSPDLTLAQHWPDLRTVPPDLVVPRMIHAEPAAGVRVRQTEDGWNSRNIYHALYLPTDWAADRTFPVIVEYAGNGGYRDPLGDECTGRPEDCHLGYGMTAGEKCIWICLPYLNAESTRLAITWWGDPPEYDPRPTLKYCHAAVDHICRQYGGDRDRILLCGFSRGAIACNFLGLYDDETAKLWRAFVACSHYDGLRPWPYPGSDAASAAIRLARLRQRPQFICGEKDQIDGTREYLRTAWSENDLTFVSTGFQNHSDEWVLRPSAARKELRQWLRKHLESSQHGTNNQRVSE